MDHPDNRYLARALWSDARAYSTQHVDIVPSVTFGALCKRARDVYVYDVYVYVDRATQVDRSKQSLCCRLSIWKIQS